MDFAQVWYQPEDDPFWCDVDIAMFEHAELVAEIPIASVL
eukprot:SAG31_NODE_14492_length_803_cov_1.504261_1_plen_39_part_10